MLSAPFPATHNQVSLHFVRSGAGCNTVAQNIGGWQPRAPDQMPAGILGVYAIVLYVLVF